jgi:hypothetical protein
VGLICSNATWGRPVMLARGWGQMLTDGRRVCQCLYPCFLSLQCTQSWDPWCLLQGLCVWRDWMTCICVCRFAFMWSLPPSWQQAQQPYVGCLIFVPIASKELVSLGNSSFGCFACKLALALSNGASRSPGFDCHSGWTRFVLPGVRPCLVFGFSFVWRQGQTVFLNELGGMDIFVSVEGCTSVRSLCRTGWI